MMRGPHSEFRTAFPRLYSQRSFKADHARNAALRETERERHECRRRVADDGARGGAASRGDYETKFRHLIP